MEHSVLSSEVGEIRKNLRSFDLYDDKFTVSTGEGEDSGGKRKRDYEDSESPGLGHFNVIKKSSNEGLFSCFEAVSNLNSSFAGDGLKLDSMEKTDDRVFGEARLSGFTDISHSLDGNDVSIPKKPRCFTRRKKVQSSNLPMQAEVSGKLSSDGQLIKLSGQFVMGNLFSEGKLEKGSDDSKENSSSRENLAQSFDAKDSASLRYADISLEDCGERCEPEAQEQTGGYCLDDLDIKAAMPCDELEEHDENNLEENAARRLTSRLDPDCTGLSGSCTDSASQPVNGLSCGTSILGDIVNLQFRHSANVESDCADAEGRILRPRRKGKHKRHTRKRRHFYEILSREVEPYWVVNRRIKVFWPLDLSWYFGLVTSYDPHRKLHHVKYDDRDEEWINLKNERFKLLLLPSEAPRKPDSEKSGSVSESVDEEEGDAEVEKEDDIDSYLDSEPIITWLARSSRRVKSSLLSLTKRRKMHSQTRNTAKAMLFEGSVSTLPGCLVDGSFRADVNKLSSESVFPDKSDGKETPETMSSKDRLLRFAYFRKRSRQRAQVPGSTSDKPGYRSIVVYDPIIFRMRRFRQLNEDATSLQCVDDVEDLCPGCVFWFGENFGLLKLTVSAVNTRKVTLNICVELPHANHTFEYEYLRMCHTLLLLQYGTVMAMWPKVQLEMLFVDNVFGLRFLSFEGCLMQAVTFVCLVLVAFHQPYVYWGLLDQQIPVTSIRFELSGPRSGRRFIFVLHNFAEIKKSNWLYLDSKLKKYCSVTKQLPLSECTYDNIWTFQNRSSLLPSSVCQEPVSLEVSRKRSRQGIMCMRIAKEPAYANMSLSSSSCNEKSKRVPQFLLPFSAAPTFFLGLHIKLSMAKNVASFSLCNPLLLLEDPKNSSRLVAGEGSPLEEFPDQNAHVSDIECTLSRTATVSGLLSSANSEVDVNVISMNNEGDLAMTSHICENNNLNVLETSLAVQDSWPSIGERHSSQEKRDTELLSHLNGIKVQIPIVNHVESQSGDEGVQSAQQLTSDSVWSVNDCAIRSPTPTAPRSVWNRNRHSSGSLSLGNRSKVWHDGREEVSHSGLANGSRKPKSQISYLLPFGNCDFSSKPRSHHRKGRPYKRMKTDGDKTVANCSGSSQRRLELFCEANLLITVGDRGWREFGAHVVLDCIDQNEWRVIVKVSGVTKFSYKAYQFLQPGTTNRYTHAMMWKGGKEWILEFPDRSQWTVFKEMHEECYNRNLRAASVKTIPIPGVRLIEEIDDIGVEVPFFRSSPKYFLQLETDVDMALNPSRILYDMDSDDENWLSKRRASSDPSVSSLTEISEELFEKAMDMFEKVACSQQHEDFTAEEIQELMGGGVRINLIKDIYEHWKQKRRVKGMPLIRQLQPPLWGRYQQQLKEWELAVNKIHHFPNGCKEKAMLLEKPPIFAFCLRPRGLEVPNKGSKQRSQRKVSSGAHSYGYSRDSDGHNVFGRRSNGIVCGDERFPTGSNHEYGSSWQISTRVLSPRDAVSTGYMSMSSDGSERSHHRKLQRNKSKKSGTFISDNDSQGITTPYNQRLVSQRNGVSKWNVGLPEWSSQNQYQQEGYQRHKSEKFGGPDLDEFRLRDASSAAQHATNMAKLKREKAQRLFLRADLAIHKAMVALMTADAIKASSEYPD